MTAKEIRVDLVAPPIPVRSFDWRAWRDGNEEFGPYGWGATSADAVADLLEQEKLEALPNKLIFTKNSILKPKPWMGVAVNEDGPGESQDVNPGTNPSKGEAMDSRNPGGPNLPQEPK